MKLTIKTDTSWDENNGDIQEIELIQEINKDASIEDMISVMKSFLYAFGYSPELINEYIPEEQ